MAAYAALVSLMANIDQITKHPRLSTCFDGEQMDSLLQKARSLLEFVEGGYNRGGLHFIQEAEDLEREITFVAHAVEDVVESHVVDQILAEESMWNKVLDCMIRIICFKKEEVLPIDLQHMIQEMGAVAERAREEVEEEQPPTTHPTPPLESGEGTAAMVGLDEELTQLLDSLTDHHSNRHVISIVGMGGTGKTTLAQNLYAHPLVKEHFDILAWATISQQYNSKDILSRLLSCIGILTEGGVGGLGEQLHKSLFGKRYLIVLDDIWDVEAWDRVRRYLPDSGNSSRVVLTTRLSNIASDCGSTCFDLNLLDEAKSWELFCNKAMFPLKDGPPQLEDVAKKIVKSCKGLALSIVVIGGLLLKSPRTVGYWVNVLKGLEANDSKEKQLGLDALSLSYNHLPPHLKPCFLYMGTFMEDSRISASNITRLWVAEGFIKPKGTRVLEEIAEDQLKELSNRNLVLGLEYQFNGKIKSFSIHDLLRDLCIKVAEEQEFIHVRKWHKSRDRERTMRRIVCEQYKDGSGSALARSILQGRNYSLEYAKHKLLRVFDATENMYSEDVYGNNVNLRYLVHKRLSANVCHVWNLQALIIKDNYELVVAPSKIWKIWQLRHLKCRMVYLPDPPFQSYERDQMEQLQTLKTAVNLRLSDETCEIIPNIKKLHLLYDAKMRGYDDSLMECLRNVNSFHKLESLSMEIMTSRWPRRDPELSSKLTFPLSLNKLCLNSCMLCWEDLSMIGSLPKLQVLQLKQHAVMEGDTWSPVGGQFLCLKFLEIDNCNLHSWDADSSHFPVLEKLVLRSLIFLKEIAEITTLGLIHMDRCSESAAISAVQIKKDQLENYDNETLQIEIKVFESDLESMKKKMEEEDLPLNLINKLDT